MKFILTILVTFCFSLALMLNAKVNPKQQEIEPHTNTMSWPSHWKQQESKNQKGKIFYFWHSPLSIDEEIKTCRTHFENQKAKVIAAKHSDKAGLHISGLKQNVIISIQPHAKGCDITAFKLSPSISPVKGERTP